VYQDKIRERSTTGQAYGAKRSARHQRQGQKRVRVIVVFSHPNTEVRSSCMVMKRRVDLRFATVRMSKAPRTLKQRSSITIHCLGGRGQTWAADIPHTYLRRTANDLLLCLRTHRPPARATRGGRARQLDLRDGM